MSVEEINWERPDIFQVVGGPYDALFWPLGHQQYRASYPQIVQQVNHRLRLAADAVQVVQADQMPSAGLFGQGAFYGLPAHLARQCLVVVPGMRPEGNAAMPPLGGAGAALTGASGVFLDPGLAPAAGHLSPGLGVVSALPFIFLVNNQRLVHQGLIHRHVKDSIIQADAIYRIALLVSNRDFHNN
jgi:hypothetical protein